MLSDLLRRVALGAGLTLAAYAPVFAANTALHLNLPTIKGESVATGHVDWIDLSSLQWGAGVGISRPAGSMPPEVSPPSVSDVTWSQRLDTSVPKIFGAALTATQQPKARFDFMSSTNASGTPYLTLELGDRSVLTGVSMASDSVAASMGSDLYKWTYNPAGLGHSGSPVSTELNQAKGVSKGSTSRSAKGFTGTASAAAAGQTSIYLRLNVGGSIGIAGDSQAKGYENWIELDSAQMGVGLGVSFTGGSISTSKPSVSELTWTQREVGTLPAMLANLAQGKMLASATIEYVTTVGGKGPVTFMQLMLGDVLFSGLSISAGESGPSMSASIDFGQMKQTVWEIDSDGDRLFLDGIDPEKKTTFSYNRVTNKSSVSIETSYASYFGTGNLTGQLDAMASSSSAPSAAPPIPEPQTWVMMLAGLGLILAASRRMAAGRAVVAGVDPGARLAS